jgi:hypothetical protein
MSRKILIAMQLLGEVLAEIEKPAGQIPPPEAGEKVPIKILPPSELSEQPSNKMAEKATSGPAIVSDGASPARPAAPLPLWEMTYDQIHDELEASEGRAYALVEELEKRELAANPPKPAAAPAEKSSPHQPQPVTD